jgi:hypothetical protein
MARKAWGDLSPDYRDRLERRGITETAHAFGAPLRAARGHGAHTPTARAHEAERAAERGFEPPAHSPGAILAGESGFGYVPLVEVVTALDKYGEQTMSAVMQWQTERTEWAAAGKPDGFTPQPFTEWAAETYPDWYQMMLDAYGYDYFDDFDDDIWNPYGG